MTISSSLGISREGDINYAFQFLIWNIVITAIVKTHFCCGWPYLLSPNDLYIPTKIVCNQQILQKNLSGYFLKCSFNLFLMFDPFSKKSDL